MDKTTLVVAFTGRLLGVFLLGVLGLNLSGSLIKIFRHLNVFHEVNDASKWFLNRIKP